MDIGTHGAGGGVLVYELESSFRKFVCVKDIQEPFMPDEDNSGGEEEGSEELEPSYGPEPCSKCLEKSATFPCSGKLAADEEDAETETALRLLFSEEPILRPASLPLVSAMKGSREKQGASPRKLTVAWAPDVYDPIPNSLSHTVKSKQKKFRKDRDNHNNCKKNGKKGQKGNSSRGGGGKDKKLIRKLGGRSDKFYKTMDASDDHDGFDVGSPDLCGSSFLKESLTKVHYSVAEAL